MNSNLLRICVLQSNLSNLWSWGLWRSMWHCIQTEFVKTFYWASYKKKEHFTEPILVRPIQSVLKLLKFHLKKFDSEFQIKTRPKIKCFWILNYICFYQPIHWVLIFIKALSLWRTQIGLGWKLSLYQLNPSWIDENLKLFFGQLSSMISVLLKFDFGKILPIATPSLFNNVSWVFFYWGSNAFCEKPFGLFRELPYL